ncbi:hypothetical protein BH09VER1_BH09VER1_11330 [soil metagenome]
MPQGSPFWQGILFLVALLFLAWETWRGWRRGVIRSGINFAALVLSTVIGTIAAKLAAAPFGGFGDFSGAISGLFFGTIVGLVVFVVIWLFGAIAFKRTDHQGSGIIKMVWGSGGAIFGFLLGLFIVWGGISIVRGLGALAEGRVATAESAKSTNPGSPQAQTPVMATQLATLKQSLELGTAGKIVESVDVIPSDSYELIGGIGRLINDQATMLRFIQYPGIQDLMKNPKLTALLNDPTVLRAAQEKNYPALMSNKALLTAVQDPALAEELGKIDLKAALKFALETPTPSPSPSHHAK